MQCARLLEQPELASWAGAQLAVLIRAAGVSDIDVVVGPAMGGILVAHELARALGARSAFVERDGDRVMRLRRGFVVDVGMRVVVAEDVVTTGGSAAAGVRAVRDVGGDVVGIASLIDRSDTSAARPAWALARVTATTTTPEHCTACAAGHAVERPGSRDRLRRGTPGA